MSSELEKAVERERLSAENSELRRQIEDLSRRVGRNNESGRSRGGGGAP